MPAAPTPIPGGPNDPNVKMVGYRPEANRYFTRANCVFQMQSMMESCFGKSVMSGVMGFGMGGIFGMFMASVRPPP